MQTSKRSRDVDIGKIFEAKISQAFRELENTYPVSFKRLIDSRDAGNFVIAQECDFELLVRSPHSGAPYHFMIEAKASTKFETFSPCFRSLVKTNQRAKMMVRERAGAKGLYFFYSEITGDIEIWHGKHINDAWPEKRTALNHVPIMRVALQNLEAFGLHMIKNPEAFAIPAP